MPTIESVSESAVPVAPETPGSAILERFEQSPETLKAARSGWSNGTPS